MLLFSSQLLLRYLAHLLYNFSSCAICLFCFHAPTRPLVDGSAPPSSPQLPWPGCSATRPRPSSRPLQVGWQRCRRAARGADWLPGAVTRRRPREHADGRSRRGWSGAPGRGTGARGRRSREAGGARALKRPPSRPPAAGSGPGPVPTFGLAHSVPAPPSGAPGTRAASGAALTHEGRAHGRQR